MAEARRINHPYSLAFALNFAAYIAILGRDVAATAAAAGELMAISNAQGFQQWLAAGAIALGWVMAHLGDAEQGDAQILQVLGMYDAMGFGLFRTQYAAMRVDALRIAGRPEDALAAIDEALAFAGSTEERAFLPQLHYLRGEVLVELGRPDEGEREFEAAVTIGRAAGSNLQALRAAVSWVRSTEDSGGADTARAALAEILAGLFEGGDAPEIEEARQLLSGG